MPALTSSREDAAFPVLGSTALARIEAYGAVREVAAGDVLFAPGDAEYDFYAISDATVSIVHRESAGDHVVATHGPGRFLGELGLLSGARPLLTARGHRLGCPSRFVSTGPALC
jgi:thioredoxin reductase (NADPH)